ncbi:hypothetical protein CANCADRAFT_28801 [Tortispora caseinolytica NRRL Y-17796]|uniref:Aminopeptidase P N-terminal domain-containing protein n=1 Tax=Tortispora caseinolytica NRRL Y-17796 TaxID=767744 RepID=A0A1E4TAQ8_9ASCO|nr:hypothetical protein CANCADRAFT_28801 [Tortispora caseinolytica NRRL Y-17796]
MTIPPKYPAKQHALKVKALLGLSEGLLYIESEKTVYFPNCDQTRPFRQNRSFYYLTGCDLPDCYVTFDLAQEKLVLYLPPIDDDDVMWSGMPLLPEEAMKKYDIDSCVYESDLESVLSSAATIHVMEQNKRPLPTTVNAKFLLDAIDEARATKDEYEIAELRKAAEISDHAHLQVMMNRKIETNECHVHAESVYHCMRSGSKHQAYDPICCAGTSASTLHYVRNDQPMLGDGQLLFLIDAGAEWNNYASDVTRCFPIGGEWTKESLEIYTLVQKMQAETMQLVRPGVHWEDLHLLSHKILVQRFLELGIFRDPQGKPVSDALVQEVLDSRVSVAFYPHGLGHMLGMNTHDTAGRANYEDPDIMFRYLRIRRPLEEGFYVTVEPGCYFNKFLIEDALKKPEQAKYIDQDVLERYWKVGGVRIEDDVLVTADGYENFTKITSDPEEISKIVRASLA